MEVGEAVRLTVKPLYAAGHVVVERLVALFRLQGVEEEFSYKKRNGEFVRMERDGREGHRQTNVTQLVELHMGTDVDLGLQ